MVDNKFKFGAMISRLNRAKVELPKIIAEAGRFYFAANFRKQSWDGVPWKPRLKEEKYTKAGKIRKNFKPLLVKSGHLRDEMNRTILSANWHKIVWGTNVPYARYLNYGTSKMVSREFLGDGKQIRGKIKGIIKTEFDKIMKVK